MMHSIQRHNSCNLILNSTPSGITDVTSCFTEFSQTSKAPASSTTLLFNTYFRISSSQDINNILMDELSMTMSALKAHPKVYWIWNHRRWCLENVPTGPGTSEGEASFLVWKQAAWDKELYVVEKMLDADSRNCAVSSSLIAWLKLIWTMSVQAWDYRRYVLGSMPVSRSELSELAYTRNKIESNFSNFSAWHQRSKVLTSLWAQGRMDERKSREDGA
jgi:geranylgeranyl transferase type-2 subunit alpha